MLVNTGWQELDDIGHECNLVWGELQTALESDRLVEVVLTAMYVFRDNPGTSVAEALAHENLSWRPRDVRKCN